MLVINTLDTAEPRLVGGGLNDPATAAPVAECRDKMLRQPQECSDTTQQVPRRGSVGIRSGRPESDGNGRALETEPTAGDVPVPSTVADELVAVWRALLDLVPAAEGTSTLGLVHVLGAKLDGHAHCARQIHPGPSVSIDEARARCQAWLFALRPAERGVVLVLLDADVREADR